MRSSLRIFSSNISFWCKDLSYEEDFCHIMTSLGNFKVGRHFPSLDNILFFDALYLVVVWRHPPYFGLIVSGDFLRDGFEKPYDNVLLLLFFIWPWLIGET